MRFAPFSRKVVEAIDQPEAVAGAVSVPSGASVETGGSTVQGWQSRAWHLWSLLGELHYPTTHLARQVGRLNWAVSVDGRLLSDRAGGKLLEAATIGPGLREASRMLALNLQVAGECRYVEQPDGAWAIFSVSTPGLNQLLIDAKKERRFQFRLYNPDPIDPEKADSSVRTVIGPAEELLTYQALARAQSRSRIGQAGMLLVPTEASFDEDADPFGTDLETAMMTPIQDVDHPSAMVPVKVEMAEDLIEKPRHLILERPYDDTIHEKEERAIKRIALALDIPPELLLGVNTTTHWTAWLVALETYTAHLEPLASPIGELYAEVIQSLFEKDGREVVVTVAPDAGELLAKRSTVRDAMDAAKIGAVGLEYVREAIGADPEDAPSEDDLEILRLIPRETGREPMADELTGPPEEAGPLAAAAAAALEPGPTELPEPVGGDDAYARGRLEGAIAMCADGARTKIGSKLRTQLRGSELAGLINGVHNRDVVAALGLDRINGNLDLNVAVVEALIPFGEWWMSSQHSESMPSATASLLVGIWVADTLALPASEMGEPPAQLVSDLLHGLGKEVVNA